jgi:hypothetical protein
MVTTPNFDVLHFIFKIGGAQRPKWTFLADKKCPFLGGSKLGIFSQTIDFKRIIFGGLIIEP